MSDGMLVLQAPRGTTLLAMSSGRWAARLPPMWARWMLAVLVGAAVIVGTVVAINRAGPEAPTSEAAAEAEINRASDIAITEDEAPHSAGLAAGAAPAAALERAIAQDVHQRIASHQLTGPLQSVICTAAGAGSAGRDPYHCTVRSSGISYPFLAVAEEPAKRLTWCKDDPPAVANAEPEVPISASCR